MRQHFIWIGALLLGAILGLLHIGWIDNTANFVASIYVRLFQLLAVPTIFLAVTTTLASLGKGKETGRIFGHTITYTLLTTIVAATVGMLLYVIIAPEQMPVDALNQENQAVANASQLSYSDHLLSIIPNNVVKPFLEGNVLSLLLIAAAVGLALTRIPESDQKKSVLHLLHGFQEILFTLIHGLIWILPVGIVAFAVQLSSQLTAGTIADSLGKYVIVVLGGNLIQFFIVLPLFLLIRGLNPIHTLRKMSPAVLMALFTKSSAATLPVTMSTAEQQLGVQSKIARFVLPICTTINMNGCAAFILVTSLFVMQQGGIEITWATMLTWLFISVVAAIGNAGVPMGCYFLTLSLMSGIDAPVVVLGAILPIYTIIDMVETAVNVWSDSCVCAMTNKDLQEN